jgi:RND family efflux transporter MFP subunit
MNGKKTLPKKTALIVAGILATAAAGFGLIVWGAGKTGLPATRKLARLRRPSIALRSFAQNSQPGSKPLYYVDPMHPSYKSDKPGVAPDCGMQLVPVYAEQGEPPKAPDKALQGSAMERGPVQISTTQQHLIGLTTARATYRSLGKTIRAAGRVDLDETRVATVHVRVSGWVQQVFVDYTFAHVKKGDPLFTLYSPELLVAEDEYLLALKARSTLQGSPFHEVAAGGESLLEAAGRRLSLSGVTAEQVHELEQTGKPQREITFYSPVTGHVSERKVFPNQYVTPDTELYKIADHSEVWVYASVYEDEISLVSMGQEVLITSEAVPNRVIKGRVNYIQPHLMEDTRTLPVRIEVPNPELKLNPGLFVNVELKVPLGRRLTVPDSAVLDSGTRQLVFVQEAPGILEPRIVQVGIRTNGLAEILAGLKAGETVASSATFLIDSESQLQAALAGMALGTGVTGIGGPAAPSAAGATPSASQLQITFHTQSEPPKSGKNHVTVTVRDAAGRPVDNAEVKIVFYMPAMPSMSMPAMRAEAPLGFSGSGTYAGEIQVHSPGQWQVSVEVRKQGKPLGVGQFSVTAE